MKYIKTEDEDGKLEIFAFPNSVNHDCMAEMLGRIKNQTADPWRRIRRTLVSAGFVNFAGVCYGESFTLGLRSEEGDTELMRKQMLEQN